MRKTQPTRNKTLPENSSRVWIRPGDRGTLLVLALSCLVMIVSYWLYRGGHRSKLIELDRVPPMQAKFQVDVNRADWPEIIQLEGLGETLARRILAYRNKNGPFRDLDDLVRVRGIGSRTLERIRPYLQPIPKDANVATSDTGKAPSVR